LSWDREGYLQRAAAMKAGRPVAVYGTAALLCLLLTGCAADTAPTQATAPVTVAAAPPPAEPELSAPEPEAAPPAVSRPARKTHKPHKAAHRGAHAAAKAAPPPQSFRCHIVREADLEGAAGQPPDTEPAKVDLYARVDPQAHTLSVERATDPAFAQAAQHCGDGKPSPATSKKKYRKRQVSRSRG
jgi:hypothetical protein